MTPSTARGFSALLPSLALIAAVFALSACELAYHEFSVERDAGCSPWRVGCQPAIDVAGEGPIQTTWYDVHRSQLVSAAEQAPHRQCDTVALGCQFVIMFDTLGEQYFRPL
jgi:hypothetical protein